MSLQTFFDASWEKFRKERALTHVELFRLVTLHPRTLLILPCKSRYAKKELWRCLPHWLMEKEKDKTGLKSNYDWFADSAFERARETVVAVHNHDTRIVAWRAKHDPNPDLVCKHCLAIARNKK